MNITFKQPEIELALRQYMGRKLDLSNSTLAIAFNMGRGENGLVANLTIEDALVPNFSALVEDDVAKLVATGVFVNSIPDGDDPRQVPLQATKSTTKTKVTDLVILAVVDVAEPVAEVLVDVADPVDVVLAEVATASVLTEPVEAPIAEAKPAEAELVPEVPLPVPEAAAKTTTSLFGPN